MKWFVECKCSGEGSKSNVCDSKTGKCTDCKDNVVGDFCTECNKGYFKFPDCECKYFSDIENLIQKCKKNKKKLILMDFFNNYHQPVNVMLMDLLIMIVILMENVHANLQSLESNVINVLKVSQDFLNVINVLMDILVINVKVFKFS